MGTIVAVSIIALWAAAVWSALSGPDFSITDPFSYVRIALNTFLYTGLFITAHDAMHGTVSRNKIINNSLGRISCFLFAAFSYSLLKRKHFMHHSDPTGDTDPDYGHSTDRFFPWFIKFLMGYSTIKQFLLMALIFNILIYFFPQVNVILYWLIPSVLSSIQLFYFGTYRPHRLPVHGLTAPHFARSQKLNHLAAFFSCYFFGYHHEHHSRPGTPWWKLYKLAEDNRTHP